MSRRTLQIAEQIQQILGQTIQYELKDPRVNDTMVTVTNVVVSGDLYHARVQLSIMGDENEREQALQGLRAARGFLRRSIAEQLRHLRTVPELHLEVDTSLDHKMRIDELLHDLDRERRENPPRLDDDEPRS